MLNHRFSLIVAATSAFVAPLAAQSNYYCYQVARPAFGIQAYQCANCGVKLDPSGPTSYTFFAEPVVTQVAAGSSVATGDVIMAVDASPITTQDGADRFAHPGPGMHVLTVRRGRDRADLRFDVASDCAPMGGRGVGGSGTRGAGGNRGGGFSQGGGSGSGQVRIAGGQPVRIAAGSNVRITNDDSTARVETGKFGFAVTCRPSCSATFGARRPGVVQVRRLSADHRRSPRAAPLTKPAFARATRSSPSRENRSSTKPASCSAPSNRSRSI